MKKFDQLTTTAIPLLIDHIDTDQIIPARFLKTTVKTGIGENLFRDWRYLPNTQPNPDFVLNQSTYSGELLIGGENFGCGSSREHAVWALMDFGFRVVMATSFADIFKQNALNNGLIPLQVAPAFWESCVQAIQNNPSTKITVDLNDQTVKFNDESAHFEIDAFRKQCILKGYTDLDYLVSIQDEITAFEAAHTVPAIGFQ
ncbi:MAG: 3-isopropylmalate dehydratase small subunit [Saprospiraceae bacterium]|nr:3-isopropylmalate dehydratase small subunit [Saprospiraceae bacterium]